MRTPPTPDPRTDQAATAPICWPEPKSRCRHTHDSHELAFYGRCRSGQRWFWAVDYIDGETAHGWADSETGAIDQARAAVSRLSHGRPVAAHLLHRTATLRLKAVNAQRRKNRPPADTSEPAPVEYLYGVSHGHEGNDFTHRVVAFRIAKKTSRRVYYVRRDGDPPALGYVDRRELEAAGHVTNHGVGWYGADFDLYTEPPQLDHAQPGRRETLARLKLAMFHAHPDQGGTAEAFRAARERYVYARRA